MNEVVANPAAYGFANVTTPACGTTPSLVCTSANLVTPNAASTYLFADGVHPTTAGHAIFAQLAESMIDGPQQMAALAEAPLAVEQANYRALDGRMWSSLNAPRTQGKLEGWAAYDYGHTDLQAGPSNGSAYMNTIAVGGDMKVSDHALVGLMFGFTENKGDFGGAGGGYTMRQPVGTIYGGYGDGPWYVGATMGAGSLDYSDINRAIPLGTAIRTENGQARGYEYTGRLLGGYWFAHEGPAAWSVRAPRLHEGRRPLVFRNVHGQHGTELRPAGARTAAVERGLAGRGQLRRHSSVRAGDLGIRLEGPERERQRVVGHAWAGPTASPSASPTTATRCSTSGPAPNSEASPGS